VVEFEGASVEAIEAVYRAGFGRFVRVALAVTRSQEVAIDAVQEAFASALQKRSSYAADGPLEAWVWRAVLNAALKESRRRRPLSLRTDETAASGERQDEDVRTLIAALPERQRLVLFLHYYADLDYRSIASALELEVGTVGATLNQARSSLKARLLEAVAR
jgi:RNA polymerase sigma-70 factor (ECF subfamily)